MADQTKGGISWTQQTWNPLRGCSKVSAGCQRCYAMHVAARFSGPGQPYEGLATRSPARWTGEVRFIIDHLADPMRWQKPRRVFVNSMSDLFHESVPFDDIAAIFGVMALSPQHQFQILTKRAEGMRDWFIEMDRRVEKGWRPRAIMAHCMGALTIDYPAPKGQPRDHKYQLPNTWPLPNVWLGVSVEDQKTADERIPFLLETPAAIRFISAEPLLGLVELDEWLTVGCEHTSAIPGDHEHTAWQCDAPRCGKLWDMDGSTPPPRPALDWVIVGGESGHGARDCDVSAVREIVLQCKTAIVPCFVKQLGASPVTFDSDDFEKIAQRARDGRACAMLKDSKGADPAEWPEDLRIQQWPERAGGIDAQ